MDSKTNYIPSCLDFTEFEAYINSSRKLDDNIILTLNKTDGSILECSQIWNKFDKTFKHRENLIKKCISELEPIENEEQKLSPHFRSRKRQISFLKSELEIEKILIRNAETQFKRKCVGFKPKIENL